MTTTVATEPRTHEVTFRFAKETENTLQFKEVTQPGKPKLCGTLYVQKHATFDMGENPVVEALITIKPS